MKFFFKRVIFFLFLAVFHFIGGCSHHQQAPLIDIPCQALNVAREQASQDALFENTNWICDDWWTLFQDPQLTNFILLALERNPSLHSAEAKIFLAAANADRMRASLFPNFTWGGDISRQKLSETGVIPFGSFGTAFPVPQSGFPIPIYFTLYETQLNLNYEFDFWGKNRNNFRAALSEMQANIADEAFARMQLSLLVASVYFQLQTDYKREEIATKIIKNKSSYLELIRKRTQGHIDNVSIINSNQNNLSIATETLLQIQGNIAINEYKLKAYLAGNFEEEICISKSLDKPLPKIPLPCEIPLHLIAHRPDIMAQIWLIESAGKQIEVAKAGFYPDFNLSAFFGFQTIHFAELFKWPSSYFNVDQAFSLPIFDGGKLLANLHGREINYDLAIFQYNDLILNAVQEVLSGIAMVRNTNAQLLEAKKQLSYQKELFKLATLRLKHNINSTLDTLINEENMLVALDREIQSLNNTIQAILSLIKALGGGYNACYESC